MNKDKAALRNRRLQREYRARWWFQKMRQVVELAMPPQPLPPPEQIYLKFQSARGTTHAGTMTA